jgi:hypothetical protein
MPPPPRKKLSSTPPPRIPKRNLFRAATQDTLFDLDKGWEAEWKGMPEFISNEQLPFHTINVHLENRDDMAAFAKLVEQTITEETKYIWYPKKKLLKVSHLRYTDES